jgi:hypothetical protein
METVISRWFAGCSEPPSVKLVLSLGWIYCSNTTPTARGTELRALLRLRPARGHPPGDRGLQRAIVTNAGWELGLVTRSSFRSTASDDRLAGGLVSRTGLFRWASFTPRSVTYLREEGFLFTRLDLTHGKACPELDERNRAPVAGTDRG